MKLYPTSTTIVSAAQKLRREIRETPHLKEKLKALGRYSRHYYNKQQVELILETFSISIEEYEIL